MGQLLQIIYFKCISSSCDFFFLIQPSLSLTGPSSPPPSSFKHSFSLSLNPLSSL